MTQNGLKWILNITLKTVNFLFIFDPPTPNGEKFHGFFLRLPLHLTGLLQTRRRALLTPGNLLHLDMNGICARVYSSVPPRCTTISPEPRMSL